jgi:ABC-type spermidine/putrescine transport system permease subunit II
MSKHSGINKYLRPLFIGLIAFAALLPLVLLAWFSLTSGWLFPQILPGNFDFGRWGEVMTGYGGLLASALVSAAIAFPVAALSTVFGFVTARTVAYSPHREQFMFMAYLPFAMSPVILSLCLLYLFLAMDLVGTITGVILAQMMSTFAFAVIFFASYWTRRARNLEQLVLSLGGTIFEAFSRVLIPASIGPLTFCFFQTFMLSWFQYGLPLVIGAGKVQTLPVKVFSFLGEASPHYASMAAVMLIVPPLLLLWINRKYLFEETAHVA